MWEPTCTTYFYNKFENLVMSFKLLIIRLLSLLLFNSTCNQSLLLFNINFYLSAFTTQIICIGR